MIELFLSKTGDSAKVVDRAQAVAQTRPGTTGIKVAILSPYAKLTDKIVIDDAFMQKLKEQEKEVEIKPKAKKAKKK